MKAVTIWQPYAGLIACGVKPVENRTWAPPARPGTVIAIHAGAKYDLDSWEHCIDMRDDLAPKGQWIKVMPPWALSPVRPNPDADPDGATPYSAIIGVATLDEVRHSPRGDDPWWVGPVGWYFRDPVAIEPVFIKGAQGLWTVPDHIAARVDDLVRRTVVI